MPLYSIKVLYWGAFENVHIMELIKNMDKHVRKC